MTQIPLSIEQTVAAQPKRSTATKLVVGLLAGFAVVCVYQNGHRRRGASRVAVSPLHLAYRVEMSAHRIGHLSWSWRLWVWQQLGSQLAVALGTKSPKAW